VSAVQHAPHGIIDVEETAVDVMNIARLDISFGTPVAAD
jgi:hypothetical protein